MNRCMVCDRTATIYDAGLGAWLCERHAAGRSHAERVPASGCPLCGALVAVGGYCQVHTAPAARVAVPPRAEDNAGRASQ